MRIPPALGVLLVLPIAALGEAPVGLLVRPPSGDPARAYTVESFMVPMSDSVRLNTRVAIPSTGAGPWPVMLYRTPYNVEWTNVDWIADAGYVGVSQDTRGRFASEGIDRMWRDEGYGPDHQDGLETVRWTLRQTWCNGRIATYGGSASAINENLLAAAYPESVRCMVSYMAAADLYDDLFFPGGAFKQNDMETWLRGQGAEWNIDSVYVHPNHDAWWRWLDTTGRHAQETIPTYQYGGWFDIFPDGPIHSFTGLQYGGGPGAAGNQKLIMGPWIHGSGADQQGELTFPNASAEYAQALIGYYYEWFNYWIFDDPNGIMGKPPVAYYMMGDTGDPNAPGNEWRTASIWPPPSVPIDLYLREEGALSLAPPFKAEAPQTYAFDPLNPVPTLGGGNLVLPSGPYDQRPVLSRPDVLVFQTPALIEPWEVTGAVSVELYVSSDRLDTDFTAKLCDVYPDGRAMLLTDGILRARHRLRMDGEDLLVPGEVVPVTIQLHETAITFNKGHRILLAVSSSNAPRFDVNPNTGEPFMRHTTTLIAQNAVYHEPTRSSRLILPTTGALPAAAEEVAGGTILRVSAGPNPFVSGTSIRFVLDRAGRVNLRIFDPAGRRVRVLGGGWFAPGAHDLRWDGRDENGRPAPAGGYRFLLGSDRGARSGALIRLR